MESLWPDFQNQSVEENNTIKILREQARVIQNKTSGIVRATFSKMIYNQDAFVALNKIGKAADIISSKVFEERLEEELQGKRDANVLFDIVKYKFELFNDEFRFRLFVFNYSEMFPVTIEVDGGIQEEIRYKNNDPINSNDELKDVLKEIFSCHKVSAVVHRMLMQ